MLRGGVHDVVAVIAAILTQRSSTGFKLFPTLALLAFREIQLIVHLSELLSKHNCIRLQFRAHDLGPHANCEEILGLLERPPL